MSNHNHTIMNPFKRISILLLSILSLNPTGKAQEKSNLIGLLGGVALTSNPPALQAYTQKASYTDGNGGITYLFHKQKHKWYAFECQLSTIFSSAKVLRPAENETKCKFIMPLDFRFFLGNPTISAYCGAGLQYNTVWLFTQGESHTHTYYDPWWGVTWNEEIEGESKMNWTVNQLSTNLAFGLKIGFWNVGYEGYKRHAVILGTKFHFPLVNASESHGNEDKSIDLSRDRTNVSLTAALSLDAGKGWTFKFDYELPCGGNNTYEINDGGHATFLNSRSQSLSLTILKKLR